MYDLPHLTVLRRLKRDQNVKHEKNVHIRA